MYDLKLSDAIDNLSNEDVNVRKKAINSLIGVTDKKVINPLVEATTDDSFQVRYKAAKILCNMGGVARDKLIEKFKSEHGKIKRASILALKETNDRELIPFFASVVNDDDFGVRKTAIKALDELQPPYYNGRIIDSNETMIQIGKEAVLNGNWKESKILEKAKKFYGNDSDGYGMWIVEVFGVKSSEYEDWIIEKYGRSSGLYGEWIMRTYGRSSAEYKSWLGGYY